MTLSVTGSTPVTDTAGPFLTGTADAVLAETAPTGAVPTGAAPTPGRRAAIGAIRLYQLARSGRTSPCRFTPTCSHYAVEALERHGLRRGLRLTLGRLGRCRPGGPYGFDPVPE